jgi:NAD(P)-dependent dehydrogenase (short-subunit alcohol dehydrogenase family)
MRLENKVAFISGGARGMGAAEARLFSGEGCKVVIGDLRDELGRQVEAEINELGGECLFVHLDVTDEQSWNDAVAAAVARFGKLDILVNNAGIYRPERVENTTTENWDTTMSVNAKGVFLGTKAAIPELRKAGGGSIVNISSVAGLVGNHISSAYTASKGAVRLFTKSTAIQYAAEGIRCNSVHPGIIETPMTTPTLLRNDAARQASLDRTPIGRIGEAQDVAYGVLFLASDESSFMTGSELVIDGGLFAQ